MYSPNAKKIRRNHAYALAEGLAGKAAETERYTYASRRSMVRSKVLGRKAKGSTSTKVLNISSADLPVRKL
jgi:hypothetical protein